MIQIKKNDINLYDTITCGQIFRYSINNNTYTIILNDRVVDISEDENNLYINSSNENNIDDIISKYLDLNRNYDYINNYLIKNDSSLKDMINECIGFKIINSYPFETMISYMISANNNVKNITRSVNLLSEKYGKKIEYNNNEYYLFPTLTELKKLTIIDYNELKLGFRSKYIYEFVNKITEENILDINNMTTPDALKYLMSFKGIGLKIASCILLFGYSRLDVFPIDTWVKKYMGDLYNIKDINKIESYTKDKFGIYSGLVIQYMFHSKRNKLH